MAITKYESYYKQIRESLEEIKTNNDYKNLSNAFIHWYLKNHLFLDEQEIGEAMIDGGGDNGIDAILLNEEEKELTVMQFKFPNETNGINKEISEADILKTLKGFELLIDKTKKQESNALFNQFKERIKDTDIFSFKIYFVSFNDGIEANSQKELVENFAENFKKDYGSELLINIHNKSIISNIYEKMI